MVLKSVNNFIILWAKDIIIIKKGAFPKNIILRERLLLKFVRRFKTPDALDRFVDLIQTSPGFRDAMLKDMCINEDINMCINNINT